MGLFEMPKPISTIGIGIDQIPEHIRFSKFLSGNDLGMLGNIERLPTVGEVEQYVAENRELRAILSSTDLEQRHGRARELLREHDIAGAWKVLLARFDPEIQG